MPGLPAGPRPNQLGDRSTTVCKLQIRPSLARDVVQPCCRDDKRSRNSNRSRHTSTRHSPAANTRHQRHTEGMDRCCCVFLPTSRQGATAPMAHTDTDLPSSPTCHGTRRPSPNSTEKRRRNALFGRYHPEPVRCPVPFQEG